jgi:hypothetical protein
MGAEIESIDTIGDCLPAMHRVRQVFDHGPRIDIPAEIARHFSESNFAIKAGQSVAIGVGSRGIANYKTIVAAVVSEFSKLGAKPFLVPAMGSHGGATESGQLGVLSGHGIDENYPGVPIRAGMDVDQIGKTESGMDVWFSREALAADHLFVINRIKPHTDFAGDIGSGCLKMLTVGMGKHTGAANYHQNAVRAGYAKALVELGQTILGALPVLGGLGLIENQVHETAELHLIQKPDWLEREQELVRRARSLMPKIPFEDIDLLIVDRIGKNISGTGMDTNVIGRGVHGYSTLTGRSHTDPPHIRRIYVRDLSPETHGNAIGQGLADFVHQRVVDQMDAAVTYTNSLTALSLNACKIPLTVETDRDAVDMALTSAGVTHRESARIVRISDTLNLQTMDISGALLPETDGLENVVRI